MPDTTKPGRGGARPGAGRKPLGAAPLVRQSVSLPAEDWAYLESRNANRCKALRDVIAQVRATD